MVVYLKKTPEEAYRILLSGSSLNFSEAQVGVPSTPLPYSPKVELSGLGFQGLDLERECGYLGKYDAVLSIGGYCYHISSKMKASQFDCLLFSSTFKAKGVLLVFEPPGALPSPSKEKGAFPAEHMARSNAIDNAYNQSRISFMDIIDKLQIEQVTGVPKQSGIFPIEASIRMMTDVHMRKERRTPGSVDDSLNHFPAAMFLDDGFVQHLSHQQGHSEGKGLKAPQSHDSPCLILHPRCYISVPSPSMEVSVLAMITVTEDRANVDDSTFFLQVKKSTFTHASKTQNILHIAIFDAGSFICCNQKDHIWQEKIFLTFTVPFAYKYKERLPVVKKMSSKELPKVLKHENLLVKNTETNALAETNQLIYSIAAAITSVLGYNVEK
ncbi:hypothetical protein L345_00117, partial [Ophiophagus hannah]